MNLDSRIFTQKKPEKPRSLRLRELRPAHHVRKSDLSSGPAPVWWTGSARRQRRVPTLTNDNATGLGTKVDKGFASGRTPMQRWPTSCSLRDYASQYTLASTFLPCQRRSDPAGGELYSVFTVRVDGEYGTAVPTGLSIDVRRPAYVAFPPAWCPRLGPASPDVGLDHLRCPDVTPQLGRVVVPSTSRRLGYGVMPRLRAWPSMNAATRSSSARLRVRSARQTNQSDGQQGHVVVYGGRLDPFDGQRRRDCLTGALRFDHVSSGAPLRRAPAPYPTLCPWRQSPASQATRRPHRCRATTV